MTLLGIEIPPGDPLSLHPGFLPLAKWNESFLRTASQPFYMAVERPDGVAERHTFIHGTADRYDADVFHIRQAVKALLWSAGGWRVYLSGHQSVCRGVAACFSPGGVCAFDAEFMQDVYHRPFSVVRTDDVPRPWDSPRTLGGHTDGCRIGFDAGGSDRKAVAMLDGKIIYSEEVPWAPKASADPTYHYAGILAGLQSAAAHLPRVDAVGISTAGICAGDRLLRSALFEAVPRPLFDPDIYRRVVTDAFGAVPCAVVNDGDVSALSGAAVLRQGNLLGLAMGTSLAAGYVDGNQRLTGWLNELAFVPIDADPAAPADPWSGSRGCAAGYLSQDGAIRLASAAGIGTEARLSPAEQLAAIQQLAEKDDAQAIRVFDTLGVYLAHALAQFAELYLPRHVLIMGRVVSGKGGERMAARCGLVLAEEYPLLASSVAIHLPSEQLRRTGQAAAAATLPII